jgi:microcystin-dependent protein
MSLPFVAEIRMVPFNFAPTGWASCNGQVMPISQNTALFSLLGTIYGGDGRSTFALPNLQDRSPMFWGQGAGLSLYDIGETGGAASVALAATEIPAHTHTAQGEAAAATTGTPGPDVRLAQANTSTYGPPDNLVATAAMGAVGGQPHNNRQPYLGMMFIIALQGVYPPRT